MQRVYEENEWGKVSKRIVTHTISAKQQAISKFFIRLICISLMFTSR